MLRAITFPTLSHTACCHALRSFLSRTPSAFCLCVIAFCSLSHADQGKRHDADAVAAAVPVLTMIESINRWPICLRNH